MAGILNLLPKDSLQSDTFFSLAHLPLYECSVHIMQSFWTFFFPLWKFGIWRCGKVATANNVISIESHLFQLFYCRIAWCSLPFATEVSSNSWYLETLICSLGLVSGFYVERFHVYQRLMESLWSVSWNISNMKFFHYVHISLHV